jgi:hypothetical protein
LIFIEQYNFELAAEICDNAVKAVTDFQRQCDLVTVFDQALTSFGL